MIHWGATGQWGRSLISPGTGCSLSARPTGEGAMKTYINVILDKSGSMQSVLTDTIGGFNTWLDAQRKAKGSQALTLTLFDTGLETSRYDDLLACPHLTEKSYIPSGMRALLDAIGHVINTVPTKAKKVLVVIITDGYENSSHEYTRDAINALIKAKEEAGWTFAYLGATQAGFDEAGHLGIRLRSTYVPSGIGTQSAFENLSASSVAYARAASPALGHVAVADNTVK